MDDEDLPVEPGHDTLLAGTPAFEALFTALEQAVPLSDPVLFGLLSGSSLASFG